MLEQKKRTYILITTIIATILSGCSSNPNVLLQIAQYEQSESNQPHYAPIKNNHGEIYDEMSAFVEQVALVESSDPSHRATMAISQLRGIVQDTIDTNNTVVNTQLDTILDSSDPLSTGMKYASNWSPENMERIREISDEKLKNAKDHAAYPPIDQNIVFSEQNLGTKIEKLFEGQELHKISDQEYSNYYDIISRSVL